MRLISFSRESERHFSFLNVLIALKATVLPDFVLNFTVVGFLTVSDGDESHILTGHALDSTTGVHNVDTLCHSRLRVRVQCETIIG